MKLSATRYHDISCGHRVVGHESKCAHLHGHNYRIRFTVRGARDALGRVLDFAEIKKLGLWLEEHWDHKFLAWEHDSVMRFLAETAEKAALGHHDEILKLSVVWVPFNPTAENMALYLLTVVGPEILPPGVTLSRVVVEETRKCSAAAEL